MWKRWKRRGGKADAETNAGQGHGWDGRFVPVSFLLRIRSTDTFDTHVAPFCSTAVFPFLPVGRVEREVAMVDDVSPSAMQDARRTWDTMSGGDRLGRRKNAIRQPYVH